MLRGPILRLVIEGDPGQVPAAIATLKRQRAAVRRELDGVERRIAVLRVRMARLAFRGNDKQDSGERVQSSLTVLGRVNRKR